MCSLLLRLSRILLGISLILLFIVLTTRAKWSGREVVALPARSVNQGVGVSVELLTLKPTGFDPSEITVPNKPFLLVIENRAGVRDISFRFDKEVGARLNNIQVPYKRTSWSGLVNLPPGKYKMAELAHPEWSFTLTVAP